MNERDSIGSREYIAKEYIYSSHQQKKNEKQKKTLLVLLHVFCVAIIISIYHSVSFVSFSLLFYIISKCVCFEPCSNRASICVQKKTQTETFWMKYAVEWFSLENNYLYTASAFSISQWTNIAHQNPGTFKNHITLSRPNSSTHESPYLRNNSSGYCKRSSLYITRENKCMVRVLKTQNPLIALRRIAIHSPMKKKKLKEQTYIHTFIHSVNHTQTRAQTHVHRAFFVFIFFILRSFCWAALSQWWVFSFAFHIPFDKWRSVSTIFFNLR